MLRWRVFAVTAGAAVALLSAGPPPTLLLQPQPGRWESADAAIGALAAAIAWLVLCWIAMAIMLSAAAQAPGRFGRTCSRIGALVTPVVVRRAVEAAVGLTVAAVPVAAPGVVTAKADTEQPRSVAGLPSLDRPAGEAPPPVPLPAGAQNYPIARPATYVVRPGDCLWTIAARHLDHQATPVAVAATWPRWYATNRDVIGTDPDVLLPGQRLVVPKELT